MPVLTEIRNKLMGPLKNALLGAALSINPMILEKSADKEIEKATEQIVNQIAELGEDAINNIINNIGPETQEAMPPSPPTNGEAPAPEASHTNPNTTPQAETPNDFPKDPKNDILDEENQNPEREQPQNPTDPKPGEENNDPKKDTPGGNSTETPKENLPPDESKDESQKKPSPEELQQLQKEAEAQKEDEEDKKIEASKKGSITQALNTNILQRGKIKQLEAKIKKEETAKKRMKRQITFINAELAALHSAKLGLKALKLPADIIEFFLNLFIWSLGCCCLFIALVPPAKMYDFTLSIYIDLLEAQIKKISDKITQEQKRKEQLEKKIKELDTLMRQTQREIRKLQNKSVLEGIMGDKNNPYLQK
jgi:hypothetical protein